MTEVPLSPMICALGVLVALSTQYNAFSDSSVAVMDTFRVAAESKTLDCSDAEKIRSLSLDEPALRDLVARLSDADSVVVLRTMMHRRTRDNDQAPPDEEQIDQILAGGNTTPVFEKTTPMSADLVSGLLNVLEDKNSYWVHCPGNKYTCRCVPNMSVRFSWPDSWVDVLIASEVFIGVVDSDGVYLCRGTLAVPLGHVLDGFVPDGW